MDGHFETCQREMRVLRGELECAQSNYRRTQELLKAAQAPVNKRLWFSFVATACACIVALCVYGFRHSLPELGAAMIVAFIAACILAVDALAD